MNCQTATDGYGFAEVRGVVLYNGVEVGRVIFDFLS
jgi:hypothetical protein